MKLEDKNKKDLLSGAFFVLFSVIGLLLVPTQIPEMTKSWGVMKTLPGGHKLFPIMSLTLIGVCAVILILTELFRKTKAKQKAQKDEDFIGFWVTVVTWAVYAIAVMYIGYLVSTLLVVIFLLKYYGVNNWKRIAIVSASVVLFVYLVFVLAMRLPFPSRVLLI